MEKEKDYENEENDYETKIEMIQQQNMLDGFAMFAMNGLIIRSNSGDIAKQSYEIANKMLAERNKNLIKNRYNS